MKPIGVFYATREGQTRRVAEHIVTDLRAHGLEAELQDVRHLKPNLAFSDYSAALLAASVHTGNHEREMVQFVKQRGPQLQGMPAAFVSISLSEAGAERVNAAPEDRARSAANVDDIVQKFFVETGWRPAAVKPVAGALRYSLYNPLIRFIMKRIARKEGADTDTSRDYEYTDWVELDRFVEGFASQLSLTSS